MTFEDFLNEWRNSEGFIKVQSSGSTGAPKEMKLSKEFVAQSAQRTIDFFNLTSLSNLHSCVSPDFIGGKMMAVRAEISGADFSWEKPSNQPLKDISDKKIIDLLAVVPSQMVFILENSENIPKIKNIIIGGSPIHPNLRRRIEESGLNAYETYGMTETASHIALRKVVYDNIPFKTLPGIIVSTDDDKCLKIKFENGVEILTNDIAELISSTQFFIKGRRDDIIISGGKKINPIEIEEKISHLIKDPFYLTGIPDEKWGEKLMMIIENSSPFSDIEITRLIEDFKLVLENWQLPKEIKFVDKIPLTGNGKIKRKGLGNPTHTNKE